ncbi:HIP1 [Cyberlindnera jadinii]|uniref:Amino acid permease n=1 Tax=Cyberlindnera jadinii (strain ATCC 18201 / CBS 1600 / BCRC 20928 / JCM 3617 / NBRC 0987 / NRRL Y-1542) TaxID=983966 RepID=A0A0H5CDW7_CYBJN|nr:amino acid permease [Cyberlindnera jadinii NRRL Y-1542]ODV75659.1 amino acid permease [Cyberlindnera jadinii NRRL Y-1542]CEP22759.1 HIP1 [Cyberlindnera jadinii]
MSDIEYSNSLKSPATETTHKRLNHWERFKDSFKPPLESDSSSDFRHADVRDYKDLTDIEKAALNSSKSDMKQELTQRHLMMIAIGGSVGTGLFVNSGGALNTGGPAALVIGWSIIATMMLTTAIALGEMCVTFPVTGGFTTYATRFIDPSVGFAMGWNYALQWLILLPLELVAAAITIQYWREDINSDVWVAVFFVFICVLNMLDVKYYAESEVILSMIKIIAVLGFFILGIVLICGGGPEGGYIGGRYWHDPGAFSHGFKGVCSVFVTAAFSFAGTELIGMTAAETSNPRKTIPKAAKQTFWLVTGIYIVTLTLIGCLVPYDDDRLLNGDSYASVSPFVIAIENAGIKGLPSLMNVIILIAILSVANSSVYASSRVLASLADIGHAPKFLSYIDRTGRPLYATFVTLFIGLLSFIAASDKEDEVFLWLSALSGLSTIFAWMCICFSHVRFRRALQAQGRNTDELTYVAQFGVWGSLYGVGMNFLVIAGQFWVALFPGSSADAKSFFEVFLSLCIFIAFYVAHKIWKRNWTLFIRAEDMDIDTGRKQVDMELLKQEILIEKQELASKPIYIRFFHIWC